MTRNRKILVAAVAFGALAVAAGGSAFTASNTVPATTLGQGSGNVTGAVATSINYTLDAVDQSTVVGVHFVVSAIPLFSVAQLKVTVSGTDSAWQSCTTTDTTHIDCDITSLAPVVANIGKTTLLVH
jgi:hypothetical protein